ncbi:MAG TPA: hypothetical protein VF297_01610 [Pyrinomonadaceae bacterium]
MSILTRKVQLTIRAEDPATEIFIIDGDFELVGRGVGEARSSLDPGIYKVKLRAGVQTSEKLILLRGDKGDEEIMLDAFEFSSAAPLERTAKTHEFHRDAARAHAEKVDVTAGKGSWIYVFARDWTSKTRPEDAGRVYNPIRGLSLYDVHGEYVASLHTGEGTGGDWDPCAGCNVEVAPGSYRLRLELPADGGTVERTVVASRRWQTQVFLMQTDYGRGPESREADLSRGSVFLSPSTAFDPADPSHRLTELARLALASGRHRVSEELRKRLGRQLVNPMFGIYGAHLLLLEPQPDYELLSDTVASLRELLGAHPDVEAVALKLPGAAPGAYRFDSPPMLRRSWACVVEATGAQSDLVPVESLSGRISTRLWGDGSWLAWATPPAETRAAAAEVEAEQPTLAVIRDALATQLRELRESAASAELAPPPAPSVFGHARGLLANLAAQLLRSLNELLAPVFNLNRQRKADDAQVESTGRRGGEAQSHMSEESARAGGPLDDETAAKLIKTFGIPRAQIEKLLGDIEKRLGDAGKGS